MVRRSILPLAFIGLAAFCGCSAGSSSSHTDREGSTSFDDDAVTTPFYGVPKHQAVTRAYFGRYSLVQPTEAEPAKYMIFDLVPGSKVQIDLKAPLAKTGPAGGVWGDAYRVTKGGGLSYLGSIEGPSGNASAMLTTKSGGSYVIAVGEYGAGFAVELDLACKRTDGKCSPKPQPDDMCAGIAAIKCDDGLVCRPTRTTKGTSRFFCPVADWSGTCALPADDTCIATPVCGCDGKDYATECAARAAGVFAKQPYACSCDPSVWTLAKSARVDGQLTSGWNVGIQQKSMDLSFDAATGTYTEQLTVAPYCVKGSPCPAFPTTMKNAKGTFDVKGGNVTLHPDAKSDTTLPTSFTVETNCTGANVFRSHLDGSVQDYDVPDFG
jgi:hypothetical protein